MSTYETPVDSGDLLLVLDQLHAHVDAASTAPEPTQDMTADSVSRLIADAARLYSAACVAAAREIAIDARAVSATQAIMLINALMQSQNLNTFDLAVWQSPDDPTLANRRVQHR